LGTDKLYQMFYRGEIHNLQEHDARVAERAAQDARLQTLQAILLELVQSRFPVPEAFLDHCALLPFFL
jgi:hypothetical protein